MIPVECFSGTPNEFLQQGDLISVDSQPLQFRDRTLAYTRQN